MRTLSLKTIPQMLAWKVLRLELQFVILLNAWKDLINPSLYLMLGNLSLFGPPCRGRSFHRKE